MTSMLWWLQVQQNKAKQSKAASYAKSHPSVIQGVVRVERQSVRKWSFSAWRYVSVPAITFPPLSHHEHDGTRRTSDVFLSSSFQETCPDNAKSRQSQNTHQPLSGLHEEDINSRRQRPPSQHASDMRVC